MYAEPGAYTVVLTASSNAGTDVFSDTVAVYGPPAADFTAHPTQGPYPLNVAFTDTTTIHPPGDPTLMHLWRFGDGGNSNLPYPSHTYTSHGVYTVTLAVSNGAGSDTLTRTSYITVYVPVRGGFTAWPTSGVAPLKVMFANTSTGDFTTSLWDFGDGVTSTVQSPSHVYTAPGIYTVTLVVSGPGGSDTETKEGYITVERWYRVYLPLVLRDH